MSEPMTTPATPAPLPAEAVDAAEAALHAYLGPWLGYEVFGATLASQIRTAATIALRDAAPHLAAAERERILRAATDLSRSFQGDLRDLLRQEGGTDG